MGKVIVITGNQGAGKSTLREGLVAKLDKVRLGHHSSDEIRQELHGRRGGNSKGVFHALEQRAAKDLKEGKLVLLDSTGMSPRFRMMIEEYKKSHKVFLVSLTCDIAAFKQREKVRTDRNDLDKEGNVVTFVMPIEAYQDSTAVQAEIPADLKLDTTNISPEEVLEQVFTALTEKRFLHG